MPYINIWERDDTGSQYDGSESIVFVPGTIQLTSSFTTVGGSTATLDDKGCYLIAPVNGDKSDLYNNVPIALKDDKYIAKLLEAGLWVLYKYYESVSASSALTVDFLLDKNSYNVRFLTAGQTLMLQTIIEDSGSEPEYSYTSTLNSALINSLAAVCKERGDCCVVGALGTDFTSDSSTLKTLKDNLDLLDLEDTDKNDLGKYIALFASKVNLEDVNTFPDLAYLTAYGEAIKNNNTWESLANKTRGTVSYFNASNDNNATVSKYDLDKLVLNANGRSFNGVIRLNPQASEVGVLWGDRTLMDNEDYTKLKATSFLSIRNIISDVAKTAYQSAIASTYETNNEITWTNFKGRIVKLLDKMVANYTLANYEIIKKKSSNRAEIKCEIHIAPYGPVEDFDIGIILTNTNAEVTVE